MAKRVANEFVQTQKLASKEKWFTLETYGEDLNEWKFILDGPENTPYEGGKFEIKMTIPPEYPCKPPKFKMMTKIYSPYINPYDNSISHPFLDVTIMDNSWMPTKKIVQIISDFRRMLTEMK